MSNLNPALTSSLASNVYALSKTGSIEIAITQLNRLFGQSLTFSEDQLLKAKTGGPWFIKCRTAFGFTLIGKGPLKGQAIILFRGTQYLADWLTNLNISVSRSVSGQPVHDGFNLSFKSMKPMLQEFMAELAKQNITAIHCIGHSLGGALATICGDWIRSAYGIKPYIYTFGSPRVGLMGFADCCTTSVGSERIFRAYHKTDIVPCIPPWPFIHTPNAGQSYYLPSPGVVPMAEYHSMDHYIESVSGKSWKQLAAIDSERKTDDDAIRWLKSPIPTVGLTIITFEWLSQALIYVLKQCFKGAAWVVSATFGTSFTLMDQLAYVLNKGIDISNAVSDLVLCLIRKIMSILGMQKVLKAADLTRDFIRYIFLQLQAKVNQLTQSALSQVLVDGRSI
jgi:triacylglycerol lipase